MRTKGDEKTVRTIGNEKTVKTNGGEKTVKSNGAMAVTFYHGGIWRTLHCRLCTNCYGTSGRGVGLKPPPFTSTHKHSLAGPVTITVMQRRQCIVLQFPPCFLPSFPLLCLLPASFKWWFLHCFCSLSIYPPTMIFVFLLFLRLLFTFCLPTNNF